MCQMQQHGARVPDEAVPVMFGHVSFVVALGGLRRQLAAGGRPQSWHRQLLRLLGVSVEAGIWVASELQHMRVGSDGAIFGLLYDLMPLRSSWQQPLRDPPSFDLLDPALALPLAACLLQWAAAAGSAEGVRVAAGTLSFACVHFWYSRLHPLEAAAAPAMLVPLVLKLLEQAAAAADTGSSSLVLLLCNVCCICGRRPAGQQAVQEAAPAILAALECYVRRLAALPGLLLLSEVAVQGIMHLLRFGWCFLCSSADSSGKWLYVPAVQVSGAGCLYGLLTACSS